MGGRQKIVSLYSHIRMFEAELDSGKSIRGLLSGTVSAMSRDSWWPILYQSSNDSPNTFPSRDKDGTYCMQRGV
jgi:uncharacterized protein YgfB (UPF0149 family)